MVPVTDDPSGDSRGERLGFGISDLDLPSDQDDLGRTRSRVPPLLAGILPLLVAGLLWWAVAGLEFGTLKQPGPGFWPRLCIAFIAVCSLILTIVAYRVEPPERWTRGALRVLAAVASLVVVVALMPLLGFEICVAALIFTWLRFFGRESWLMATAVSVVSTTILYSIFVVALGVPIPVLIA